jgi:ATP-dependent helicase/nuclease subunit B
LFCLRDFAAMGHLVYTGSFADLEARWMEVIAGLQREDPLREINVLVGSNILGSYLKHLLAENKRGVANIRFHTFLDFVKRINSVPGNLPTKALLPSLGPSLLLEDILATHLPPVFEPLSDCPGFRDALLDTFRDLRDAEIDPHLLERALQTAGATKERKELQSGLAGLYRMFRERVQFYHDVDDDFRAAISHAHEAGRSLCLEQVLVYGIYDVTGQQSRLLSALKDAADMIYFIPFVDERVSEFAKPFLQFRLDELGIKAIPLQASTPVRSLDYLAARKFGLSNPHESESGRALDSDNSFALISSPGESRAAIEIVREVFRAVRDGTIRGFHEAAVILRQPEKDIPILTEILRLRGVPYFVHGGVNLAERPLCKAVMELIGLEPNGFSREAVLTAMELVAASLTGDLLVDWDVQSWRALTNDPRFLSGIQSWDAGTKALVEQARKGIQNAENAETGAEEEYDGLRGMQSIQLARKRLKTAESLRRGWLLLRQAAAQWPSSLPWRNWAHFLECQFQPLLGRSEDWHSFLTVLNELAGLHALGKSKTGNSLNSNSADQPVSVDKLRTAIRQSVFSHSQRIGRFRQSGVNILSTSAARGLRFPLVIVPGLDEGRFPARLRQDPLLLDSEREQIGNLSLKAMRIKEEKLLFDMAARSAQKRLVLMTSRLDESSDREKIPSQFFLSSAAVAQGRIVAMRDLVEGALPGFRSVSLDNPIPKRDEIAIDEGEIRLRLIGAESGLVRLALAALEQLEPDRISRPLKYDNARWLKKLTDFDGSVTDPVHIRWIAQTVGPSAGQVSASRFEEYAKCPYLFFLKRVMGLQAWEEQRDVETVDPLERGLVVHSILEKFLKDLRGEALSLASMEDLEQSLKSLTRDSLEKSRPAGMPDLLWEVECDNLLTMLHNWLVFEKQRANEGMLPADLERIFGEFSPVGKYPAFKLKAGNRIFEFRGRIDRIDLSRDGKSIRVVDYKTGSLPGSMSNKRTRTPLMSGERIQIAIYKGALGIFDEYSGALSVQGEYLHLQPKDGRIVPCSYTDEELSKASKTLPGILRVLAYGMEHGVFFARTSGTVRPWGHCSFCDYLPICGKDRMQREERKANDRSVRRFLEIREMDGGTV